MKNKITTKTKIPRNGLKAWLRLLPLLILGSFGYSAQAQTYCGATYSWGCGNGGNNPTGNVTDVTIKDATGKTLASWSGGCTQNVTALANPGKPIDVTAGEKLTVTVKGTEWTQQGWMTNIGAWIDTDKDGSFSAAENIADPAGGPLTGAGTAGKTAVLTMPCFSGTGASRIRFRGVADRYNMSKNCGCGNVQGYGSAVDFEVNLKVGAPPVANFIVPTGPNYERTVVSFNSTTPSPAYIQDWIFSSADVNVTPSGAVGQAIWNNPGTYNVELKQDYCGVKDSITKQVTIVAPTSIPVADFVARKNTVEQYFDMDLIDLSSNGAYLWAWEVTSPQANVYTDSRQNPDFFLDEIGDWDVCLTSENGVGPSTKVCKTAYVKCVPPTEFYMGPNNLGESKNGTLYDHAGPTADYGTNRKPNIDYFKIVPCGATEINFSFADLALADANDKFRIYDAAQEDPAKELSPSGGITGANVAQWKDSVFTAKSGAMYLTFQTDGSGQDRGFIGKWTSVLAPPSNPTAGFTFPYNPSAIGVQVDFDGTATNTQGEVTYDWQIDANGTESSNEDFSKTFVTDGTYNVCFDVQTLCNQKGATACKDITIITPTKPGILDYVADKLRPKVLEAVSFTTSTDYANKFKWSIFPLSYEFINGTNDSSKNPVIEFKQGGPYTFTLNAWNFAGGKDSTQKKVIKNKYVVVLDPCTPLVGDAIEDAGISNVNLKDANGVTLIDNASSAGVDKYTDYSLSLSGILNYGKDYTIKVDRPTNSNDVNVKAWIDFNVDGDFADAGEMVLNSGAIAGLTTSATFTVPKRSLIFEGKTRMRIGSSYSNFSNTPCGVNRIGEFEDYEVVLVNDGTIPVITLVGTDTISVEKAGSANACWSPVAGVNYNASDENLGDLNGDIVVASDLDCTLPGIYTICYNVEDASGNQAATKCRTVYVVLDRTPPTLTINSVNPLVVEQCNAFTNPTAIATDIVDGNLSTAILVSGTVDADKVGDYTLTYSVQDAQGNKTTQVLDVQVRDTKKPSIELKATPIVDGSTIKIQIKGSFIDEVYTTDGCNGIIATTKTPLLGPVDADKKGIYPVRYNATDASANVATEDGYVINYSVDDLIAPLVNIKTADTIIHDVNTDYISQPVEYSDNFYPNSKVSLIVTYGTSGKVDDRKLGTYSEIFTATDESGNSTSKIRTVKVVDRIAPIINVNPINACVGAGFNTLSGLILEDNYYGPAILAPLVEIVDHNINVWEAGVYYINYRVTDPSGNKSRLTPGTVYVAYPPNCQNTFLSTGELSLAERVTIFPNPAENSKFNVSYNVANADDVAITVRDMTGRTVYNTVVSNGGLGKVNVDLTGMSSGIYNVTVRNAGAVANKQVVLK